jgi:5-methylcytosine-specific restriction protein A
MTTRRRRPGAWSRPERGPDGRALCRWCRQPVPKGRRTFCSDACVEEWRLRSDPGHVRHRVWQRDHGVCARCGLDTEAIRHELEEIRRQCLRVDMLGKRAELNARAAELLGRVGVRMPAGWPYRTTHLWEAHHRIAVVEGGGECGLDGYETLCRRCHALETAALRRRRPRSRKNRGEGREGFL